MDYYEVIRFADEILAQKDPHNHHGISVENLSIMIANSLKLPQDQMNLLSTASRLHDVGKILINDELLNYPRKLTRGEYARIQTHVNLGYDLLTSLDYDKELCEIIRSHHEHYDGSGYPRGLKGEEIPYLARIICIADSWDSMRNNRAYREAMPQEKALAEMNKYRYWFDPSLFAIFLSIVRKNEYST